MKQLSLSVLVASSLLAFSVSATTVHATPVNQTAIAPVATTAAKALKLKDDTLVSLKGTITKSVGDEKYQFKDASGTIVVDIDDELWQGKPLASNQSVTIRGEIDVDYLPNKRVEVDVEQLVF